MNIVMKNCHFENVGHVARLGPDAKLHMEGCTARDVWGHAVLKHPSAQYSGKRNDIQDQCNLHYSEESLKSFRVEYKIPDRVSDSDLIVFGKDIIGCESNSDRVGRVRKFLGQFGYDLDFQSALRIARDIIFIGTLLG